METRRLQFRQRLKGNLNNESDRRLGPDVDGFTENFVLLIRYSKLDEI